jgi:hypothetical protein
MQSRAMGVVVPATAVHVPRHQEQTVQLHTNGQYRRKRPVDDSRDLVGVLVN